MESTITAIVSIVTAIGIGGVLGAYFQALFQRRTQIEQHQHDLKQKRYLCILILMLTKLDPKNGLLKTREFRPDLKTLEDVNKELETELLNGFIYASDEILESLSSFIREPNHRSFVKAAASMRKDLWSKKTSVNESILDVVQASEREN